MNDCILRISSWSVQLSDLSFGFVSCSCPPAVLVWPLLGPGKDLDHEFSSLPSPGLLTCLPGLCSPPLSLLPLLTLSVAGVCRPQCPSWSAPAPAPAMAHLPCAKAMVALGDIWVRRRLRLEISFRPCSFSPPPSALFGGCSEHSRSPAPPRPPGSWAQRRVGLGEGQEANSYCGTPSRSLGWPRQQLCFEGLLYVRPRMSMSH